MYKIKNINVKSFESCSYDGINYYSNGVAVKSFVKPDKSNDKKRYFVKEDNTKIYLVESKIIITKDDRAKEVSFEEVFEELLVYCKISKDLSVSDKMKKFFYEYDKDVRFLKNIKGPDLEEFTILVMLNEYFGEKLINAIHINKNFKNNFYENILKLVDHKATRFIELAIESNLEESLSEILSRGYIEPESFLMSKRQAKSLTKVSRKMISLGYSINLEILVSICETLTPDEIFLLIRFIELHYNLSQMVGYDSSKSSKTLNSILSTFKEINAYIRDFHEVLNYYTEVIFKEYHFLEDVQVMNIYRDYLKIYEMAEKDCMDLTLYDLYPKNIKLAHSEIIEMFNRHSQCNTSPEEIAKFSEIVNRYSSLTYENDIYKLITPNSPLSLYDEGKTLSHCVVGYKTHILKGYSKIFFLRSKENLDKPLVTVEVRDNNIRQARGYKNTPVDEVMGFIHEWAKEKNLNSEDVNYY